MAKTPDFSNAPKFFNLVEYIGNAPITLGLQGEIDRFRRDPEGIVVFADHIDGALRAYWQPKSQRKEAANA